MDNLNQIFSTPGPHFVFGATLTESLARIMTIINEAERRNVGIVIAGGQGIGRTLMDFIIASVSDIPSDRFRAGDVSAEEMARFSDAIRTIAKRKAPMWFVDGETTAEIKEDLTKVLSDPEVRIAVVVADDESHSVLAREMAERFRIPVVVATASAVQVDA